MYADLKRYLPHYVAGCLAAATAVITHAVISVYNRTNHRLSAVGRVDVGSGDKAASDMTSSGDFVLDVILQLFSQRVSIFVMVNVGEAILLLMFVGIVQLTMGGMTPEGEHTVKQRLKEFFLDKLFEILFVLSPLYDTELLLWVAWFSVIGLLEILVRLSRVVLETNVASRKRVVGLLLVMFAAYIVLSFFLFGTISRVSFNLALLLFADLVKMGIFCAFVLTRYYIFAGHTSSGSWRPDSEAYVLTAFDVIFAFVGLVHHIHVWIVVGVSVSVLDIHLLLRVRAGVMELMRCYRTFLKFKMVTYYVDNVLADATQQELRDQAAQSDDNMVHCCICIEEMTTAKKLPGCMHLLHRACLWRYLLNSDACPICRAEIMPPHAARRHVAEVAPPPRDGQPRPGAPAVEAAPPPSDAEMPLIDADASYDAEENALRIAAAAAHTSVDPFLLTDARKRAMIRRCRDAYLSAQQPAASKLAKQLTANDDTKDTSQPTGTDAVQSASEHDVVLTDSVEEARRKCAAAARRRLVASASTDNN